MQHVVLKDINYSVENLPSEPRLLIELLELCHNDGTSFESFASTIAQDPSLTSKILQVANSPSYRQWNQVTDIRRMLITLGLSNVRHIVTTCAIQQFFSSFTNQFKAHTQSIWLRAILCANLAERLAKLTGYKKAGEAFLAGLLHQIGMLVFLKNREQEYLPILDRYYTEPQNYLKLEENLLQATYCELGAALVNSWQLDSFISDAIAFQHEATQELLSAPALLKILATAAPLCAYNSASQDQKVLCRAGELFNLTEEIVLDCLQKAREKSRKIAKDIGFEGDLYLETIENAPSQAQGIDDANKKLEIYVRNMTLANTIGKVQKNSSIDFARDLRVSFHTLFSLDRLLFFQVAKDPAQLIPINDTQNNQLNEIIYDLNDSKSQLVKSLQSRQEMFISSTTGTIADRQVMRLLESDEALLLPITRAGDPIGLVILGLLRTEVSLIEEQIPLLTLMAQSIGESLYRQNQKTAAEEGLSQLELRKITHEVSNPLTIARNYLYILGKKLESNEQVKQELQAISDEIERAGNILIRAKEGMDHSSPVAGQVDINKLIKGLDQLFKNSLFHTYQISSTLTLDDQIPVIASAPDKLKQILINLIKNSVEAMPEQGEIFLTTRDNCHQGNEQYVEISIRDTGKGIPSEILSHLFHPVKSTKDGHSGLGLTIVKTLVDEIHGQISCYSTPQQGTEFKLLIPRNLQENKIGSI